LHLVERGSAAGRPARCGRDAQPGRPRRRTRPRQGPALHRPGAEPLPLARLPC